MPAAQLDGVVHHLRLAALGCGTALGDADLLERFIVRHDEAAFAALVRRHGPMVLGVCRRVLRHEDDAEDAFQATFLVLVRKAAAVVPRARVGNWLYGVARKTALKARARNDDRRRKEREAARRRRVPALSETRRDLLGALDDALARLPDRYRAPLVLCELEGLSYQEAARQLGCPPGTLSGRLTRARRLLARRLAGHGGAAAVGLPTTLLARHAGAASVPPQLTMSTVKAASAYAAGQAAAGGAVSAAVLSLTEEILKMMVLHRLKAVLAALVLAATAVVVGWLCQARASEPATRGEASAQGGADTRPEGPAQGGAEPGREAAFTVVAVDPGGNAVEVVVAGTAGPVLSLPLKTRAAIVADGRPVGPDRLAAGARVALRMDRTHRAVVQVRLLDGPRATRVLPASAAVGPPCPPSHAEVLRALPPLPRSVPYIYEAFRDDVKVANELLVDTIDLPRLFPLVGRARLHHCHWKCTVSWSERVESAYPFAVQVRRPRVAVIYVDKDHLISAP
jgi:RNA polymerase sigma factor (sigma-70 family)